MPLKHSTENVLIAVLAVMVLLAGIAVRLLWSLSGALLLWWALPLAIAFLYPLLLYPLLQSRRAEYGLRALHFAPAVILLMGLGVKILTTHMPTLAPLGHVYSFGGALAAVAASFALLMRFSVSVLRQWQRRVALLFAALVPFAFLGVTGEGLRGGLPLIHLPAYVAQHASSSPSRSSAAVAAQHSSSSVMNVSPSHSEGEEVVRMQLRRMERRQSRLAKLDPNAQVVHGAVRGATASADIAQHAVVVATNHHGSHLPSSGFDAQGLALTMAAGYTAILHVRMKKRMAA